MERYPESAVELGTELMSPDPVHWSCFLLEPNWIFQAQLKRPLLTLVFPSLTLKLTATPNGSYDLLDIQYSLTFTEKPTQLSTSPYPTIQDAHMLENLNAPDTKGQDASNAYSAWKGSVWRHTLQHKTRAICPINRSQMASYTSSTDAKGKTACMRTLAGFVFWKRVLLGWGGKEWDFGRGVQVYCVTMISKSALQTQPGMQDTCWVISSFCIIFSNNSSASQIMPWVTSM